MDRNGSYTTAQRLLPFYYNGSQDMILYILELPVWTGSEGQGGLILLNVIYQVLEASRLHKHYDLMTCCSVIGFELPYFDI